MEKNDTWEITLHYGYHDEDTTPSDIAFNNLVDAIETKFRFLAGLNDKVYRSYPLQRVQAGLFTMFSSFLCHRAIWQLKLQERVESTESE